MSKAMGGDFGTGAAGAAAAKLAVEMFAKDIKAVEGVSEQDKNALIQLLGLTVAKATTQLAGGSAIDGNAAGVTGKLATEFNYLQHEQLHKFKSRYRRCESEQCKGEVLTDMKQLSDAQDTLLSQCTTTESCKSLTADVAYPTQQNGFMGIFVTDTKDVYEFCSPGDKACHGTLDYIAARSNQAALTSIAPEFYAAINWQNATMESAAKELEQRFGLSPQAASMLAVTMAGTMSGAGKLGQKLGEKAQAGKNWANRGGTYVDILSPEARKHILYGDGPGSGGHLWPGQSGKTVFPESWSANKVMHDVGDIATSPNTKWYAQTGTGGLYTKNGDPAKWVAYEVRDGVQIRVVYQPATGKVVTAFPDPNPVPSSLKAVK